MAVPPQAPVTSRSTAIADVPAPRQAHGSARPAAAPETATQEPAVHEPAVHEPAVHEPAVHEPAVHEPAVLAGLAWIVREVTHVPGVLRLRHGRLSFESTRGVLFDGTAADLGLELGRSSRTGMQVTVGAERLRVCVVRPPGGVDPCRDLVDRAVDRHDHDAGLSVTSGRSDAWTTWRTLLAPEPPAVARPRTRVRRAFTFAPS